MFKNFLKKWKYKKQMKVLAPILKTIIYQTFLQTKTIPEIDKVKVFWCNIFLGYEGRPDIQECILKYTMEYRTFAVKQKRL